MRSDENGSGSGHRKRTREKPVGKEDEVRHLRTQVTADYCQELRKILLGIGIQWYQRSTSLECEDTQLKAIFRTAKAKRDNMHTRKNCKIMMDVMMTVTTLRMGARSESSLTKKRTQGEMTAKLSGIRDASHTRRDRVEDRRSLLDFRKLRQHLLNRWSIFRSMRPAAFQNTPHLVVQSTRHDFRIRRSHRTLSPLHPHKHLRWTLDIGERLRASHELPNRQL